MMPERAKLQRWGQGGRGRRWVRGWVAISAACLLLGAATTVGVAWGIALSAPRIPPSVRGFGILRTTDQRFGRVFYEIGFDVEMLAAHGTTRRDFERILDEFGIPGWVVVPGPDETSVLCSTVAEGWPLPALKSVARRPIGPLPPSDRVLPMIPIWRGAAVDTLLYAAGWWSITAAPAFFIVRLRARRRRRAGKCPFCGYDLRGLGARGEAGGERAVCPECGE